jgi:elongator complex protein 1
MGDIVVVHLDNRKVEPVGIIDAGIVAMEWSPDTELVIVITSLGTVLEMTRDFYTVTEFPVDDEDDGACKSSINKASFVSVGWGKKETQFHGRIGKEAAKEVQSQLRLSENDDRMPRVTWRGDGEYFVISYASTVLNRRVLRVFNREGNLLHVSEPVNQLEHCLSWKLSGNLITSTQMLPHKHDVVFFEKNGLRHGEFSLKEKDSIVKSLSWNSNSSLLAMLVTFKEEYGMFLLI